MWVFKFLGSDVASPADRGRENSDKRHHHPPGESESRAGKGRVCLTAWARGAALPSQCLGYSKPAKLLLDLGGTIWHCGVSA